MGKQNPKAACVPRIGGFALLVSLLVVLAFAPASALASRVFLREIKETTPGSALAPSGIAVDGKNDLWVESGKNSEETLAEFGPVASGNPFVELLPKPPAVPPLAGPDKLEHLAVEDGTEDFYVVGGHHSNGGPGSVAVYNHEGKEIREWEKSPHEPFSFVNGTVTVDNAPLSMEDPSGCALGGECSVYVTETGFEGGIMKFNPEGTPEPFTASGLEYVTGNKITGIPGRPGPEGFGGGSTGDNELRAGLAVDVKGDIYAAGSGPLAVYEYEPSGSFLRSFDLNSSEVPEIHEHASNPSSVAVDPVTGHLLVGVEVVFEGEPVGAIDEFETEGAQAGKFVGQITAKSGGEPLGGVEALSVDSKGDVYAVEEHVVGVVRQSDVVVYGPDVHPPVLTLAAATQRTGTGAQLNGTVNPNGFKLTQCEFQYVPQAQFEAEKGAFTGVTPQETAPCTPSFEAINATKELEAPHEVTAQATGLTAGDTYRYRLVAHSEEKRDGSAETASLAFTAPAAPGVSGVSATEVSSAFADLHARIAPHGAATSYHFEYLTAAAFAANGESFSGPGGRDSAISTPTESLGSGGPSGGAIEAVEAQIGGLAPSTEYRFRLIAENECEAEENPHKLCSGESKPEAFTTLVEPAQRLPDHRAYELVTPANKEGGSDMFSSRMTNNTFQDSGSEGTPSLSGDGFLLTTKSPFGPFPASGEDGYVFTRDYEKGEWTYVSLASPQLGVQALADPVVFDPADLSRVAFSDGVGSDLSTEGERLTALTGSPGGPYTTLHQDPAVHESTTNQAGVHHGTQVVGASHDLSHIVLESGDNSVCGPTEAAEKVKAGEVLCESDGGELRLVNLAPGSETEPASACGATLGGSGQNDGTAHDAVSTDGSRVLFTAPDTAVQGGLSGPGCWNQAEEKTKDEAVNPPQLYLRLDGQTLKLSAPEPGVFEEEGGQQVTPREYPVAYSGASEDDSKIFFKTRAWLTADHPEAVHDDELYECEVTLEAERPGCRLTRISAGQEGAEAEQAGAEVDWVPAVSADGEAVYYTAFGVLVQGAKRHTPTKNGANGLVNVYRYDTESRATSYVATVDTLDYSFEPECETGDGEAIGPCSKVDWSTTPNGEFLLFGSSAPIGGYNVEAGVCAEPLPFTQEVDEKVRCSELYRYDAQLPVSEGQAAVANNPVCVSCGPGGADHQGDAEFARSDPAGATAAPPAAISDNGDHVFFDSQARLVSQADNHTLDVYEWQAQGTSGCEQALGCVRLVSSPNDAGPSYFLGSSPYEYTDANGELKVVEGGNIFFGTHASLVPQDTNTVGNVYDARICEPESPCIKPPPPPPLQCEGGSCQTPPTSPNDPAATLLAPPAPAVLAPLPPKKTAAQIKAEQLAKALKKCKADKSKKKRKTCEAAARKKYKTTKAKKSSKSKRGGNS